MATDHDSWATLVHEPGHCSMYGICGHREDMDVLSCPNNTQAHRLPPSGQQKLQNVCPQLAKETGLGGGFCCTEEQLDRLQAQASAATAAGCNPPCWPHMALRLANPRLCPALCHIFPPFSVYVPVSAARGL